MSNAVRLPQVADSFVFSGRERRYLLPNAAGFSAKRELLPTWPISTSNHFRPLGPPSGTANRVKTITGASSGFYEIPGELGRSNVHQNVHQKIKKDRFRYVRIRLDFAEKPSKNRGFLADSDPRLHRQTVKGEEDSHGRATVSKPAPTQKRARLAHYELTLQCWTRPRFMTCKL